MSCSPTCKIIKLMFKTINCAALLLITWDQIFLMWNTKPSITYQVYTVGLESLTLKTEICKKIT